MGEAESSTQFYSLSQNSSMDNGLTLNTSTNVININFDGTANFVHEITHVDQFENHELGFLGTGTVGQDIYDEVAAYEAQYAYDPSSLSGLNPRTSANSFSDITKNWVEGIKHPARGFIPFTIILHTIYCLLKC